MNQQSPPPAARRRDPGIAERLSQVVHQSKDYPEFVRNLAKVMLEATSAQGIAFFRAGEKGSEVGLAYAIDPKWLEQVAKTHEDFNRAAGACWRTGGQQHMAIPAGSLHLTKEATVSPQAAPENLSPQASIQELAMASVVSESDIHADQGESAQEPTATEQEPSAAANESPVPPKPVPRKETELVHLVFTALKDGKRVHSVAMTKHEGIPGPALFGQATLLKLAADRSEAWFHKQNEARAEATITELEAEQQSIGRIARHIERTRFAYDLVNEVQNLVGCDRVAFLTCRFGKCKAVAYSGQPTFDKRSNSIRRLTSLTNQVTRSRAPFWSDEQEETVLAPEVEKSLDAYREESNVRSVAVLPLLSTEPTKNPSYKDRLVEMVNDGNPKNEELIGAVVLEQVETELDQEKAQRVWGRIEAPVIHAAMNSRRHHSIFLMPLWLLVGQFLQLYIGSTQKKAIAITLGILAAIVALIVIPAEHTIRCEGVLRPTDLQHVYAREEGAVDGLMVSDGQRVQKGDLLLRQQSFELEESKAELQGELARLESEAKVLQAKLVTQRLDDESQRVNADETLMIEYSKNQAELAKVREMNQLATERLNNLDVRASFPGVVYAWNIQRRLGDRPVSAGDKLFSIARVDGTWELELKVPDRRAAYVTRAWHRSQERSEDLKVTYIQSSSPGVQHPASVQHIPGNFEVGADEELVLPVRARLPSDPPSDLKPGTPVVAKVHCGSVSLGYAKLYEFYDFARRIWFTYVF